MEKTAMRDVMTKRSAEQTVRNMASFLRENSLLLPSSEMEIGKHRLTSLETREECAGDVVMVAAVVMASKVLVWVRVQMTSWSIGESNFLEFTVKGIYTLGQGKEVKA